MSEMICAIDSLAGIYAPKEFVERYEAGLEDADPEDVRFVKAGPDHEHYWDAWMNIETNAKLKDNDGVVWSIYQDGDIFLVPPDFDWDSLGL